MRLGFDERLVTAVSGTWQHSKLPSQGSPNIRASALLDCRSPAEVPFTTQSIQSIASLNNRGEQGRKTGERHAKMERANEKELAVGQALENRNLSRVPLLKSRRTRLGGRIVQRGFKLGARRNALESLDNLAILEEQKRRNRIDPVLR